MTDFNHGAFVAELRKRRGKIPADLYADMMAAITAARGGYIDDSRPIGSNGEPQWLAEARRQMGVREIAGKRHEPRIIAFFKAALASWFSDDETPWCGAFVAHCMIAAGQPIPPKGTAVRALAWAEWGQSCLPRVGAVAVFGRQGGGHVGFVVGESSASLYILGGNQANAVNITPISKSRLICFRWPAGLPIPDVRSRLPAMSGGTVSVNEA